jgi:hypothetical protein
VEYLRPYGVRDLLDAVCNSTLFKEEAVIDGLSALKITENNMLRG